MELQKLKDWTDIILKVVSIFAILVGGVWAFYQFNILETTANNVQVNLSAESKRYDERSNILVIHAKIKNLGKVIVEPGKKGFLITVKSVPSHLQEGPIDLEKTPEVAKQDILKRYPDGYAIEPGAEYNEIFPIIVPKNSIYIVKAEVDLRDDTEVDDTAVVSIE